MADGGSFADLRERRLRYVESARENDFEEGLRSLLADLYPDNAHFIYELLQNAEDAQATVVEFELGDNELTVSHNGARAFSLRDIESITGIGTSTKRDDETQIGKFGVGFKAVFAYTTRPQIRSGDHSFAIADLFVPEAIDGTAPAGATIFTFPLDRQEKPTSIARAEVERGLRELDEKTLLFLNNIREITYSLPGGDIGFVKRVDLDELTIRVEASQGEGFVDSTWLRLIGPTSTGRSADSQLSVAAAFKLEPKGAGRSRQASDPDAGGAAAYGIAPLDDGEVSIYFPAEKEASGLKFHIHAPFASTVARDSVRDTPENTQLVADIGSLIVSHLHDFRDRGLIDDGFLATLPNPDDGLKPLYGQIQSAIVEAFNEEDLTPVRGGGDYCRARSLVSSPSEFRVSLEESDLRYLMELGEKEFVGDPRWVIDRDGRAGRFVRQLDTLQFDWPAFRDALGKVSGSSIFNSPATTGIVDGWKLWLEGKDDGAILNLYELLGQADLRFWLHRIDLIRNRDASGIKHVKGPDTYLPPSRRDGSTAFVPIELAYFDDEDSKRANNLRTFYRAAGVDRWDERAKIDSRLNVYRRRDFPDLEADLSSHLDDVREFVQFAVDEPKTATKLFSETRFLASVGEDGDIEWMMPSDLYLDEPFRSTGLSALYAPRGDKSALAGFYLDVEGIDNFVAGVGTTSRIEITPARASRNPHFRYSWWNGRRSSYTIDRDWEIEDLGPIVATGDPILLQSLWETVLDAKASVAYAQFQLNRSAEQHDFESKLRQQLMKTSWILDREGALRHPREMTADQLREGWRKPESDSLVYELGFGAEAEQAQKHEAARPEYAERLGIALEDVAMIQEARAAGVDLQAAVHEAIARRRNESAFPNGSSTNPERRAAVASFEAAAAAMHETEVRPRSVVSGQGSAKAEAKAYLQEQYTNAAGDMYCQACHTILPFKVKGHWYFQAIDFVPQRERVHRQNSLALCPLCAATYRHKRETSNEAMIEALLDLKVEAGQGVAELPVLLNGSLVRIRFTGRHALDLQSALAVAGGERANS